MKWFKYGYNSYLWLVEMVHNEMMLKCQIMHVTSVCETAFTGRHTLSLLVLEFSSVLTGFPWCGR